MGCANLPGPSSGLGSTKTSGLEVDAGGAAGEVDDAPAVDEEGAGEEVIETEELVTGGTCTVTVTVATDVTVSFSQTEGEGVETGCSVALCCGAAVRLGGAATAPSRAPTIQVCSGVKLGGEQGVLLKNPSALSVRHWFPGPTPLLVASRTNGKPIPPARLALRLKKYCWSSLVSPSPTALPPIKRREEGDG